MSLPIVWMRQKHRLGLSVCLCVRTCMPGRRHCLASLPSTSCNFSLYLLPVKYHLFLRWIKINYRTVLLISTIVGDNTAGRFAPTLCEYIGPPPEGESWVEWITIWKPVSLYWRRRITCCCRRAWDSCVRSGTAWTTERGRRTKPERSTTPTATVTRFAHPALIVLCLLTPLA